MLRPAVPSEMARCWPSPSFRSPAPPVPPPRWPTRPPARPAPAAASQCEFPPPPSLPSSSTPVPPSSMPCFAYPSARVDRSKSASGGRASPPRRNRHNVMHFQSLIDRRQRVKSVARVAPIPRPRLIFACERTDVDIPLHCRAGPTGGRSGPSRTRAQISLDLRISSRSRMRALDKG